MTVTRVYSGQRQFKLKNVYELIPDYIIHKMIYKIWVREKNYLE